MKHTAALFYAVFAFVLCANFSTNQSENTNDRPDVNVTGKLTTEGNTNSVENITFSGLYKNIPFYSVPVSPAQKPTLNTTYIGLDAIEKIRPVSENPHESIKKFDNREYVEIIITLKHVPGAPVTEHHFLVETTRRIFCDVIGMNGIANLKKEVAIEAISSLTITGIKARTTEQAKKTDKKSDEDSAAKIALCTKTKNDLKKLETGAKKDPEKSKLIKNIQDTVNYICE